jgi:hypothetical protein
MAAAHELRSDVGDDDDQRSKGGEEEANLWIPVGPGRLRIPTDICNECRSESFRRFYALAARATERSAATMASARPIKVHSTTSRSAQSWPPPPPPGPRR